MSKHPPTNLYPHLKQVLHDLSTREGPNGETFSHDLAYLALTSKCELAIRDQVALGLHKLDSHNQWLTAREFSMSKKEKQVYKTEAASKIAQIKWQSTQGLKNANELAKKILSKGQIDLVVLNGDGNKALLCLETKAMYTFDYKNNVLQSGMLEGIQLDVLRSRYVASALKIQPSNCFVLVLVFDVRLSGGQTPNFERLKRVLAYDEKLKSSLCGKSQGQSTMSVGDDLGKFLREDLFPGSTLDAGKVESVGTEINCGNAFGFNVFLEMWLLRVGKDGS